MTYISSTGSLTDLQAVTDRLHNQYVLWHISDDVHGGLIELGKRVAMPRPTQNPHLTVEQQNYQGTHSIFIKCRCHLDVPDELGEEAETTKDYGFLDLLTGRAVVSSHIDPATHKLFLTFTDGLVLDIEPRGRLDFTLHAPGVYVTVTASRVRVSTLED